MKKKWIIIFLLSLTILTGCQTLPDKEAHPTPPPPIVQVEEKPEPKPPVVTEMPPEVTELPVLDEVVVPVPEEEIIIQKVMYTTSDLNIREEGTTNSKIIGVLRKGAKVSLDGELEDGWIRMDKGYVSFKYLTDDVPNIIPEESTYLPFTLYLPGKAISYQNGGVDAGQAIIDTNPAVSSTWGGANPWSGVDEKNTHFIAHDFGAFNNLWDIPVGNNIIITDAIGSPTHYQVNALYLVDKYGVNVETGEEMFEVITGVHEEEMVTLQTCKPYSLNNYILTAIKVNE